VAAVFDAHKYKFASLLLWSSLNYLTHITHTSMWIRWYPRQIWLSCFAVKQIIQQDIFVLRKFASAIWCQGDVISKSPGYNSCKFW